MIYFCTGEDKNFINSLSNIKTLISYSNSVQETISIFTESTVHSWVMLIEIGITS